MREEAFGWELSVAGCPHMEGGIEDAVVVQVRLGVYPFLQEPVWDCIVRQEKLAQLSSVQYGYAVGRMLLTIPCSRNKKSNNLTWRRHFPFEGFYNEPG